MNETAAKIIGVLVLAFCLIAGGALGAWFWQSNKYEAKLATQASLYQADLLRISSAGNAQTQKALEQQQTAEKNVADLDKQLTKEKTDALAKNDSYKRAIADGTRRLRIAGSCTANSNSSGSLPQATGPASVGDAGTIELSGTAGQAILDLRARLVAEESALKALQAYAKIIE